MAGSARRLAAIMFTDIVGFSALTQRSEPLAMQLLDQHRAIVREALAAFGGREVETAGDAFLIEFPSALEALRCAVAIQQRHRVRNDAASTGQRIEARIGIHLGDIEHRGRAVFGDGVNVAARIEPLAPAGGIAVSTHLHAQVQRAFPAPFRALGPQALKNIAAPVEVFALEAEAIATLPSPVPRARARAGWRSAAGRRAAVAVAALAAVAVAALLLIPPQPPVEKSIAVLPFANLSEDPAATAHVAGGIHESILTHLAQVPDLKVISRSSVMEYADARRNLREIARALGVAHILEGGVQRAGSRVRVTAQLIEAAGDRHLWANAYDRDAADLFAIQSDIAAQVARAVEARLTTAEAAELARPPTSSADAYDMYLRALDYDRRGAVSRDHLVRMQPLLEEAIGLDPGFALAHALLSRVHLRMYFYAYDPTRQRLDSARAAAEAARRLRPDLMEGHLALGYYLAYGAGAHARALEELALAQQARPNAAEVYRVIGGVHRLQGQWDQAVSNLSRALELDPRNVNEIRNLALLYDGLWRYEEAAALYERAVALAPEDIFLRLLRAWHHISATGDLRPMREVLDSALPGQDPDHMVSYARYELAMLEGRFADAGALLAEYPSDWLPSTGGTGREPKQLAAATVHEYLGNAGEARRLYGLARDLLIAEARTRDATPADLAALAVAHAGLGNAREAQAVIQRALDTAAQSGDVFVRARIAADVATVKWRTGEKEGALAELERAVGMPFGITPAYLRLLPEFRPLHGNPRFETLLRDKTPRN